MIEAYGASRHGTNNSGRMTETQVLAPSPDSPIFRIFFKRLSRYSLQLAVYEATGHSNDSHVGPTE